MNNKIQKGHKPTTISEVLRAKAGYRAWSLHTAQLRGWVDHLSYASCPTHQSTPTLTPFKEPARAPSGSEQVYLFVVFSPSCCSTVPIKAHLNVSSGLVNFYWLKSPRAWVHNTHSSLEKGEGLEKALIIAHVSMKKPPPNPNERRFGELPGWGAHPHKEGDTPQLHGDRSSRARDPRILHPMDHFFTSSSSPYGCSSVSFITSFNKLVNVS